MTYEEAKLCTNILKNRLGVKVTARRLAGNDFSSALVCDKNGKMLYSGPPSYHPLAYPTSRRPKEALVELVDEVSIGLTLYRFSSRGPCVYRTIPSFSGPVELNMKLDLTQ